MRPSAMLASRMIPNGNGASSALKLARFSYSSELICTGIERMPDHTQADARICRRWCAPYGARFNGKPPPNDQDMAASISARSSLPSS